MMMMMRRCVLVAAVIALGMMTCAAASSRKLADTPTGASTKSKTCACTMDYNPVCNTLNGTTYGNMCAAKCAGVSPIILIPGECPAQTASCVAKCPLSFGHQNYDPVCLIDRSSNSTRVYFNPCIAQCFATDAVVGSYKGLCAAAADNKCASTVARGAVVCETLSAVELPNACYAKALTKRNVTKAIYSGQCKQAEAIRMVSAFPKRKNPLYPQPVVDCFADPCAVAPACTTSPDAKCASKYAPSYFRSLFLDGTCQAVWVDKDGNVDLKCTFPHSA